MARNYVKLDSEVYVNDFVKREDARLRTRQIRRALSDSLFLCMLVLALGAGLYAGHYRDEWMPIVQQWLFNIR